MVIMYFCATTISAFLPCSTNHSINQSINREFLEWLIKHCYVLYRECVDCGHKLSDESNVRIRLSEQKRWES